jgi:hypothetical protein
MADLTRRLKIVTQTDNIEPGGVMDDCAWASFAAAANYLTGSTFTSTDGIAFGTKVGRIDHIGTPDPSNLGQLAKASPLANLHARYPKSWDEVVAALQAGKIVGINVQQPLGYPATVRMSAWHEKWKRYWGKVDATHVKAGYGHMTVSAGYMQAAQWADPTMSGKGPEEFAVAVSFDDLKAIASSKGEAPHKRCIIWSALPGHEYAAPVQAPEPAPVAPAPQPITSGGRVAAVESPTVVAPIREVQPLPASTTPQPDPVLAKALNEFNAVQWDQVAGRALNAAKGAAAAAAMVKGAPAKMLTFLKYIKDNTGIDEALIEFIRTFVTVSISVALGLGIPLLDISGGDFRTVLSAGLASGLQVLVKYLDPKNSAFGIKEKP